MASITPHKRGYRAHVYVKGARRSRIFGTHREAHRWATEQERVLATASTASTFEEVAERWLAWKLPQLDNPEHQRAMEQSIRDYALAGKLDGAPRIGPLRLTDIDRRQLVRLVRAVAERGTVDLAHRVGQRIRAIFDYAQDEGEIEMHPAAKLSRVLPPIPKEHQPAIKAADLPVLLKAIDGYPEPVVRLGLKLLAHTFLRTKELIFGEWPELVADEPVWIIPGERMKTRRRTDGLPHVVPLSRQVLAILNELQAMTGEGRFMLASGVNRDCPISKSTLLFAIYRLGYRGRHTGHGFRAVASSVLNESKLWHPDAIERQLSHKESDRVREAYHRADYFEERCRMMQWYSDYLDARQSSTA